MYINLDPPSQDITAIVGVGTALGLILPTVLQMRGWLSFTITTLATYGALFIAFDNFWKIYNGLEPNFRMGDTAWILAYDSYSHAFTIMLPLVILMAIGMHFPALAQDLQDLLRWFMIDRSKQLAVAGGQPVLIEQESKFEEDSALNTTQPPMQSMRDAEQGVHTVVGSLSGAVGANFANLKEENTTKVVPETRN